MFIPDPDSTFLWNTDPDPQPWITKSSNNWYKAEKKLKFSQLTLIFSAIKVHGLAFNTVDPYPVFWLSDDNYHQIDFYRKVKFPIEILSIRIPLEKHQEQVK